MGCEISINTSKNEKSHEGQEGREKYSSSCSTVDRPWQAERTVTAVQVKGTCRDSNRFSHPQPDGCSLESPMYFL